MSIDRLQSKIRKMKCPIVLDLQMDMSLIPQVILEEEKNTLKAFARYAVELMEALRDVIPAVRFNFSEFAICGADGIAVLSSLLNRARKLGYYSLMNAPEALTAQAANSYAQILLAEDCSWQFDGLILSQFIGTDAVKPYMAQKRTDKSMFAIVRTGNKSGPEMQDLITGGRLVHMAQAELINRLAEPNLGRSGFGALGVMAAATNSTSLLNLRNKFKYLFILVDSFDASNANAKNCASAVDAVGHGAVICAGTSITAAWQAAENDGTEFVADAKEAAERMKKNIARYFTVL